MAQSKSVYVHVTETFSHQELSFVHIKVEGQAVDILTDMSGGATLWLNDSNKTLHFYRYLHRPYEYAVPSLATLPDTLEITLNRYLLFQELPHTPTEAARIIKETIRAGKGHSLPSAQKLSYQTYSKLHIAFGDNQKANEWIRRLNRKGWTHAKEIVDDQYLYVAEFYTQRKILNHTNQLETVEGINTSGVRLPGVALSGTHIQLLNIYSDFISFNGKEYISPLAEYHSINRYNYSIIDTLQLEEGLSYVVAFCPKKTKNFSAIKGMLYIRMKDHAVVHVVAYPAFSKKGITEISLSHVYVNGKWLPERQRLFMKGNQQAAGMMPSIISDVWVYGYEQDNGLSNKQFKEEVLDYNDVRAFTSDSIFWEKVRQVPLSTTEKNTYAYFNENLNTLLLQKMLNVGQNIYFGRLPIGFLNVDLNKLLNHNRVEGTRVGFGFETNQRLSTRWKLSGFFGYGIDDDQWKFGVGYEYEIVPEYRWRIGGRFYRDLHEAGKPYFTQQTFQYSSESLRRLAIGTMDFTDRYEIYTRIHPLTYVDVDFFVSRSINRLTYQYVFNNTGYGEIDLTEVGFSVRWAYGEKELLFNGERIKLANFYPVAYATVIKNIPDANQPFDYTRLEVRLDQRFRILELGKTGVSVQGGVVSEAAPYNRLLIGHGSRNAAGVVVHNSFETMGYNEFAANQYTAIFLSHDFGRMYYRSNFFMPSFMIMYNIGWGSMIHPEQHRWVSVKSYDKGYKEAGFFVNNIVVLKLSGLKAGIGVGAFLRYGEYKFETTKENVLFKFSMYLNPAG